MDIFDSVNSVELHALMLYLTRIHLTGEQWRVLAAYMTHLDFEEFRFMPQAAICGMLNMKSSNVSRATKRLIKDGVLEEGMFRGEYRLLSKVRLLWQETQKARRNTRNTCVTDHYLPLCYLTQRKPK